MENDTLNPPQGSTFSQALEGIKDGKPWGRRGWKNAKFVFIVEGGVNAVATAPLLKFFKEGTEIKCLDEIDMCDADGAIGTWSPSIIDVLANDWYEIDVTDAGGGIA